MESDAFDRRYSAAAQGALDYAIQAAEAAHNPVVGTQHVLEGIAAAASSRASKVLASFHIDPSKIRAFTNFLTSGAEDGEAPAEDAAYRFSRLVRTMLARAKRYAENANAPHIDVDHLLLALLDDTGCSAHEALRTLGVQPEAVREHLLGEVPTKREGRDSKEGDAPKRKRESKSLVPSGGDLTSFASTGVLIDMVNQAKGARFEKVIGRQKELRRLMEVLARRTKNNPLLIGEPGVGKTAIVKGLAQLIAVGLVPPMLRGRRLYALDVTALVSGTKYRGEFEEKVRKVIDELRKETPAPLLFIDEIHTVVGAGRAEGGLDVANILKPYLGEGSLHCIGSTTWTEYRKHIEKDPALDRRFQPISVDEPSDEETLQILEGVKGIYESHHHVRVSGEALSAAVRLSSRYLPDRRQPDKAIDLLDEACARVALDAPDPTELLRQQIAQLHEERNQPGSSTRLEHIAALEERLQEEISRVEVQVTADVGVEQVVAVVQDWTEVPAGELSQDERARLRDLASRLQERIVGQNEAVNGLVRAVTRGRLGVGAENRPVGSFLFVGPSGCGKTALAQALAATLFGSESALVKFDMSEYLEAHALARLIGSPPGYVGHDQGGQLTEALRRRPHCVLLFDEIEKAHPDVLNLLLQLLEDGQVTDSRGAKATAKHAIVILTSNIGTREAIAADSKGPLGFRDGGLQPGAALRIEAVQKALKDTLRPELLGRIESTVIFQPLQGEDLDRILDLEISKVKERVSRNHQLSFIVGPALRRQLLDVGFSRELGARPLRSAVTNWIEDPLTSALVNDSAPSGCTVNLELQDGVVVSDVISAVASDV